MNRLIIVGSPREFGCSAGLAEQLFDACIEEYPDDEVALAPVATLHIEGCRNCGWCKGQAAAGGESTEAAADGTAEVKAVAHGEGAQAAGGETAEAAGATAEAAVGGAGAKAGVRGGGIGDGTGDGAEELRPRCCIDDDMAEIYELLDAADELAVVAPVFFSGPSAQLKALLDRLQPYFYANEAPCAGGGYAWAGARAKRPATLHVVGTGGDPYGYDALVSCCESALACAGFTVDLLIDWVGKLDEDGDALGEPEVYRLSASQAADEEERQCSAAGEGVERADERRVSAKAGTAAGENGAWAQAAGQAVRGSAGKAACADGARPQLSVVGTNSFSDASAAHGTAKKTQGGKAAASRSAKERTRTGASGGAGRSSQQTGGSGQRQEGRAQQKGAGARGAYPAKPASLKAASTAGKATGSGGSGQRQEGRAQQKGAGAAAASGAATGAKSAAAKSGSGRKQAGRGGQASARGNAKNGGRRGR